MLFFYNRLTFGLRQQQFVKIMGVIVVATYVAVFLTIMLGCYPTHKNWQVVPDPGLKCTFKMQNFYVSTVLNVLTDVAVLAIPVPLLWALQVPKRQKIWLVLLLCSGFFVIAAAIIRITMTLMANPSALTINRWGVRETIAGIIAVNIPIVRPGKSTEAEHLILLVLTSSSQSSPAISGLATSLLVRAKPRARDRRLIPGLEAHPSLASLASARSMHTR